MRLPISMGNRIRAFWGSSVFLKMKFYRTIVKDSQNIMEILEDVGDEERAISENGCKIRVKTRES